MSAELVWGVLIAVAIGALAFAQPIGTTKKNFSIPGTQPGTLTAPLVAPQQCSFCHADYSENQAPYNRWAYTAMAQSGRDPVFHAALAIAEQDASFVAELCLRCHIPATWVRNQVVYDTDPQSAAFGKHLPLNNFQLDGISCSVCHRMVDPDSSQPNRPAVDDAILAAIVPSPIINPHNAAIVFDPEDRRRGPYDLDASWMAAFDYPFPGYHEWRYSPFHLSSRMCATCHDVSSSHFVKQSNGSYALAQLGTSPNPDKSAQFPEQRTYSEWANSLFAQSAVNLNGRFGGTQPAVSSCQDCHMPQTTGQGCGLEPPMRSDLPEHNFHGANTWILRAVNDLYPGNETGMTEVGIDAAILRTKQMLQAASDLELSLVGGQLNVRIINFSGHKLPTGYSEGRRMWVNVKFKNSAGSIIAERGAYDTATATLTEADTKVYEGKIGPDATVATMVGTTPGPNFRLAIANTWYKDNRIPPMGFANAPFEAAQAGSTPPGLYADGQYWDDTRFNIPAGARSAEVSIYYQTSSREYMEFLRDQNTTNTLGDVAYNAWVTHGKSAPALMDTATLPIFCACDWNHSGDLSIQDVFDFLAAWFSNAADINQSGQTTIDDIFAFLGCFFTNCDGW